MKNCFYTLCLLGVLLIITPSCSDQDQNQLVELDPELAARTFLSNSPSLVLFTSLTLHHEAKTISGYVVDKHAQVRHIDIDGIEDLLNFSPANALEANRLYYESKVIAEVDVIALATHYRMALSKQPNANMAPADLDQSTTQLVASYQSIATDAGWSSEGCGGQDIAGHQNGFRYNRKIWSAQGQLNQVTDIEQGKAALTWIEEVIRAVGS